MFAKTVRWAFILLIAISFLFPQNTIGQVEPPAEDIKSNSFAQRPSVGEYLDPTYTGWSGKLVGRFSLSMRSAPWLMPPMASAWLCWTSLTLPRRACWVKQV